MIVIETIGNWNILVIPAIIASLVATNQQNCAATRIKSE